MRKISNIDYIKRYLLCIPLLNWALFLLSVPPAIILVWLESADIQIALSAGAGFAANMLALKTMGLSMLPERLHAKLIGVPRSIGINVLLFVLFATVFVVLSMPVLEFYRAR